MRRSKSWVSSAHTEVPLEPWPQRTRAQMRFAVTPMPTLRKWPWALGVTALFTIIYHSVRREPYTADRPVRSSERETKIPARRMYPWNTRSDRLS